MAEICCGVAGESEPVVQVKSNARASKRRRMQLATSTHFKFVAGAAVTQPSDEEGKRKRIAITNVCPRGSDNAVEGCKTRNDLIRPLVLNGIPISKPCSQVQDTNAETVRDQPNLYGLTSVCGRRRDMEDAVSVQPSFCNLESGGAHYYGVFDGHGCSHVAMKCRDRLHDILREKLDGNEKPSSVEWKHTMEQSFDKMDKEVSESSAESAETTSSCRCELQAPQCDTVGSTAVVSVVTQDKIIVSNCGDSRAVLCRNGVAIPLTIDQKPNRPDELKRIEDAGGRVIYWDGHRVLGVLAMSRAIGDSYLKPYVISEPEVTIKDRTEEDECLILASDGLWDVVSNETACGVARMCLRAEKAASSSSAASSSTQSPENEVAAVYGQTASTRGSSKACADASILLTKLALARQSTDNVSVVVVDLRRRNR